MAFQQIELNMIPHGDMPSFYASQYETGRPIIFNVMMGEDAFACDNLYVELHCRKVDDNIVTLEPDSVDGNQVTFVGTDQLFACPGQNLAELCLYADETKDTSLGSLNFFIEVEPDPLAGGLTSETQIHDLYEQVEEITQQVIGDDYYDKTETDALLDAKADKSDTYTKSQVDTALNLKADKSTTYTKTQVDNALALKADADAVYTKSETDTLLSAKANAADLATVATTGDYDDLTNKPTIPAAQVQSDWSQLDNTQVDYIKNKPDLSVFVTSDALSEIIYDLLPAGTASGAIANFDTDLSLPLVDCKANIVATGGNGTPDNPNPINGYSALNLTRCGANLWDEEWELGGYSSSTGNPIAYTDRIRSKNAIRVLPNTTYCVRCGTSNNFVVNAYESDGSFIQNIYGGSVTSSGATFITPANCAYIKFSIASSYGTTYNNDISINYPSTDTTYHAYNGQTYAIAFGQTVYGGVLDLTSGKLTVTWVSLDLSTLSYVYEAYADTRHRFRALMPSNYRKPATVDQRYDFICEVFSINNSPISSSTDIDNSLCGYINDQQIYIRCDSYTDAASFTTAMSGKSLVYPLATPFDVDLTPTQINALLGVNNVYNDTNGDTEVKYKDTIQHYIDTRL